MPTIEEIVVEHGRKLIFNNKECKIDKPPIDIYDVQGPLLFLDFSLSDSDGNIGWLRFMPDAVGSNAGPVVSTQSGKHPYFSQIESLNKKIKMLDNDIDLSDVKNNLYGLTTNKLTKRYGRTFASKEILNNYGLGNRDEVKLFCYHYPSIGFLSSVNNELVYIDIQDGKDFILTESGNHSANEETRKPYSFLNFISESGHPGQFDAPSDFYEIPEIKLIPQERDNWCAAASCQMILNYFGVSVSQSQVASEMGIPVNAQDGGATLKAQEDVFRKYLPGYNVTKDLTPLGTECIDQLLLNHPLKNGIYQHAQVIYGWEKVGSKVYYKILDPLPVFKGERKHQNPFVIYSMNFIYF